MATTVRSSPAIVAAGVGAWSDHKEEINAALAQTPRAVTGVVMYGENPVSILQLLMLNSYVLGVTVDVLRTLSVYLRVLVDIGMRAMIFAKPYAEQMLLTAQIFAYKLADILVARWRRFKEALAIENPRMLEHVYVHIEKYAYAVFTIAQLHCICL